MSIESEINRINTNVQNTLAAIEEMGGEVPEDGNSDDMAGGVRTIPVGAKIDDTTPSASTTYSSAKIEEELNQVKDEIADIAVVSDTEPTDDATQIWVDDSAETVQIPQINDSTISDVDTWSSEKIAEEIAANAGSSEPGEDGEDGGYYTPSVDSSGNLSWTASKTGMPSVASANIKGPQGDAYTLTDADKSEIVSDVLTALPTWEGGSY